MKIDQQSRELLESAIKLLESHALCADEIVMMAYNLGRIDGRMEQLDRSEAMVRNAYADAMIRRDKLEWHEGRPEHDLDTRGNRQRPGR